MNDLALIGPILAAMFAAATPLLFAALGELVVEKSGVLNLGVEGMMLVGAVCGFAVTVQTGSAVTGFLVAAFAGAATSSLFAVLTLFLLANQVATGLALTLFGVGLSALIGQGFVGIPLEGLPKLYVPGLTDLPVVGQALFGQDIMVYLAVAAVPASSCARWGRTTRPPTRWATRSCASASWPCCSAAPWPGWAAPSCRWTTRRCGRRT